MSEAKRTRPAPLHQARTRAARPPGIKRPQPPEPVTLILAAAWECLPFARQPRTQRRLRAPRAAYILEYKTTKSPPFGFKMFFGGGCGSA